VFRLRDCFLVAESENLWSVMGMKLQKKTRSIAIGATLAAIVLISGCTSSHPSAAWQGRGYDAGSNGSSSALVFMPERESNGSLVLSGTSGPEFGRLDHTLSSRDLSRRDELFGVRQERHPSLNNRRTYRSSRNADEYAYPSEDRRGHRRYRRYYRD